MGRKSKLSEEQWAEIGKRLLEGATLAALAREYNVGDSTIRSRFTRTGQKTTDIQKVAADMFEAEKEVKRAHDARTVARQAVQTLPTPEAQFTALTLFQRMVSVSEKLGAAAEYSAGNAMHFAAMSASERMKIDEAEPSKSMEAIKNSVLLQKAANEAAELPTRLIAAAGNRALVERVNEEQGQHTGGDEITPERMKEGVRRMAFLLAKADREDREETT